MKHIRPEIATYPVLHESLLATREREPLCGSRAIITPCANPRMDDWVRVYCWPVSSQGTPYYCRKSKILELLYEVAEFLETHTCNDYLETIDVGDRIV